VTGTADHRVTPADLVELEVLSDVALAPDGRLAIFASGKAYDGKEKKSPQKLIAATLPDGVCQPFSAGTAVDRMPRWSPDGSVLAFLSDRPHGLPETSHPADTQVYLLPRAGGEAHRLTSVGGEIHDLVWDPHGTCLFVLMVEPEPEDERRRREGRGDAHDVEAQPRFWRVWRVDLASGEIQPCTPPAMQVWDFALSADAGELVLVASAYPYEWSWYEARLVTLTVADPATVRTLYAGPCQLAHPRLSPDGHLIAVTAGIWSDRGAYGGDVLVVDRTDDTVRNCTADRRVAVEWAEWEPDGHSLLCAGYEEGESAFWRLELVNDFGMVGYGQKTAPLPDRCQ
jgi:dipeptidyl aminopeptidase/acylaminoacyl peptidase